MDVGIPELLIILFIAMLIFGPGRLAKLGGELGIAIRSLREGMSDQEDELEGEADEESQ